MVPVTGEAEIFNAKGNAAASHGMSRAQLMQ